MSDKKRGILQYIVCILLVFLCLWQGFMAWATYQFVDVFKSFDEETDLTTLLGLIQPLIWLLLLCTALIAFDIFRRKDFLLLNSLAILFALIIGTLFVQSFVNYSAYTSISEMSTAN